MDGCRSSAAQIGANDVLFSLPSRPMQDVKFPTATPRWRSQTSRAALIVGSAALAVSLAVGTARADEAGVTYGGAGTTNNAIAASGAIAASNSDGVLAKALGTSSIAIGSASVAN